MKLSQKIQSMAVFIEFLAGSGLAIFFHLVLHNEMASYLVFGIGVLLMGDSGVGKSEAALALVERNHRLVADDLVEIRRVGGNILMGTGTGVSSHHMEIRGLGIINIQDLFGPTAIVDRKKVEMVIRIEMWNASNEYDRLGLDDIRTDILGVSLPTVLLPVSPGRNLATIVEVAVRNYLLKSRGLFSAEQLVGRQSRLTEGRKPE